VIDHLVGLGELRLGRLELRVERFNDFLVLDFFQLYVGEVVLEAPVERLLLLLQLLGETLVLDQLLPVLLALFAVLAKLGDLGSNELGLFEEAGQSLGLRSDTLPNHILLHGFLELLMLLPDKFDRSLELHESHEVGLSGLL